MTKLNDINLQETHRLTEIHNCFGTGLSHFEFFLGSTKDAAAIVLVNMGLLTTLKQVNTRVCSKVWCDLCEIFKKHYLSFMRLAFPYYISVNLRVIERHLNEKNIFHAI